MPLTMKEKSIHIMIVLIAGMMATPALAETQMWVTTDRVNRRTCPSTECGIVGKLFYRESAKVTEIQNGWGRISKYYNAACSSGRSEYVDAGRADCTVQNGIVDGQFAEWVKMDMLSETRPADPGQGAVGTAKLVAQSDDFRLYEAEFVKAAEILISSGQCTADDFVEMGGFMKSTNKGEGIYFTYCRGGADRIYLDVKSGKTFNY
jgi:hypothetical protein